MELDRAIESRMYMSSTPNTSPVKRWLVRELGVTCMKRLRLTLVLLLVLASTALYAAPPTQPPRAQVLIFSNSSPHINVIDAETNTVIKTTNLPQMTSWGWNSAKNYFDGKTLWLGMRNPSTNDAEVVLLDLDTLQITRRIPLGQERDTLYISNPSRTGKLFVAKQASGQLAIINLKTYAVEKTINVPVSGGVACDIEVSVAADGKERAFVPTREGNTLVGVDTTRLEVLKTLGFPEKTRPFMLTATPDGRRLWVQEAAGGTVVVSALTLEPVWGRIAMGATPINSAFSPDGKLSFTGHNSPIVIATDTQTFKEVWRAQVGVNAQKVAVHPAGTLVYAIVTNEGGLVVLEATTGKLVKRISLGTNPTGIFVRAMP